MSPPTPGARRLYQGRIVRASVPDLRDGNDKERPLVIITETDEIRDGEPFEVICISTKGDVYPSVYNVPLPANKLMGLTEDCDAICHWKRKIYETDLAGYLGRMKPSLLEEVLETRADYERVHGDI